MKGALPAASAGHLQPGMNSRNEGNVVPAVLAIYISQQAAVGRASAFPRTITAVSLISC